MKKARLEEGHAGIKLPGEISKTSDMQMVDHDGYSISSEGFLPAVVDIMVI